MSVREKLSNFFGWGHYGSAGAFFDSSLRDAADPSTHLPVTEAEAMRVPAFFACVTRLSEAISQMPLRLKKQDGDGAEVVTDHPAARVMRDPDPDRPSLTGQSLLQGIVQSVAIHGNAYLEQVRVRGGSMLFKLMPIDQCRVDICVKDGVPIYRVYPVTDYTAAGVRAAGEMRELKQPQILHFMGKYTGPEQYYGISPLAYMRDVLRVSIEHQFHARASLVGGNPKGFITFDRTLTAEQQKQMQKILNDPNIDQRWKVLDSGGKIERPGIDNARTQYIESRRFQLQEFARYFGVPNHLLADIVGISNYGAGLTEQALAFVSYTLLPWATSIERVFNQLVLTDAERDAGYFFDFDFSSMLRGSQNDRADFYQKAIASGWLSPAEVRRMEGMTERDGLDHYKPVDRVVPPEPKEETPPPPQPMPEGDDMPEGESPKLRLVS